MALGDLPPRQKMINLMYLVLLCLLAMNVSKEILNSFLIINEGLERTIDNFEHKIEQTFDRFKRMNGDDSKKVGEFYKQAKTVKSKADEIDSYIHKLKKELYRVADNVEDTAVLNSMNLNNLENNDDQDIGAQVLIGADAANPKSADEEYSALRLKNMIEQFNNYLSGVIRDKALLLDLTIPLHSQVVNDVEEKWEIANFYHLPMAATITNLTRFQAAVRNSEADAMKELMRELGEEDFSFDTVSVKVLPRNGTYIAQGDSFKADVIVAAYSTTKEPKLVIGEVDTSGNQPAVLNGDTSNVLIEKGIATYSVKTSDLGQQNWGGVIKVQKPNGKWAKYKFSHSYMVARPTLVVSPKKMNVLYKGLKNPVDVSITGMPSENLSVRVMGGDCQVIKKGPGIYDIIPSESNRDSDVRLIVTSTDPMSTPIKPYAFRLKRVPKPIPFFGGKTGYAKMSRSQVRAGRYLSANLEDFVFALNYEVVSFKMSVSAGGDRSTTFISTSGRLTREMRNTLRSVRNGHKVSFYNIVAKMNTPNAVKRPLDGIIVITVQ
ncbi:MAG: hypothetical protein CL840_10655 [Crocinitomicaceae bacterium]|nr:hypothetical protein [Crocinitomicaceae bacterium]